MKVSFIVLAFSLLAVLALTGCSTLKHVDYSQILSRKGWDKPKQVIDLLGIKPGMTVADLGAGNGYFSFEFAQAVGSQGKVYAVEIDPERAAALRVEIARRKISNIIVVDGTASDPLLPDAAIDLAFLCNAYHHFENRTTYFRDLGQNLRSDARVAILDTKDTGFARLVVPKGHWLQPQQITQEMHAAGYRRVSSFDTLPYNSFDVYAVINNG